MFNFEENRRIVRSEFPQLKKASSGVVVTQMGLQPTIFVDNEERREGFWFSKKRKKK